MGVFSWGRVSKNLGGEKVECELVKVDSESISDRDGVLGK